MKKICTMSALAGVLAIFALPCRAEIMSDAQSAQLAAIADRTAQLKLAAANDAPASSVAEDMPAYGDSSRGLSGSYYSCAFDRHVGVPWGAPPIDQTWNLYISKELIVHFHPAWGRDGARSGVTVFSRQSRVERGLRSFVSPDDPHGDSFVLGDGDFDKSEMTIGIGLRATGLEESATCKRVKDPFAKK